MNKLIIILLSVFIGFSVAGCGGEEKKPAKITGFETYTDAETNLQIPLPKGWVIFPDKKNNRVIAYSSKKARDQRLFDPRVYPPADETDPAAKIEVWAKVLNDSLNFEHYFKMKSFDESVYSPKKEVTIGNNKWTMQSFEFPVGAEGKWEGEVYYAVNPDTMGGVLTIVEFDALAGSFNHYKPKFQEVLKGIKLAQRPEKYYQKADTVVQVEVPPGPSKNLVTFDGGSFTIRIPQNFKQEPWKYQEKGVRKTWNFMGERRGDCNILVQEIDAKGKKDLKAIVDEVQGKIRGASKPQKTTLGGGQSAYVMAYVQRKNTKSQVYYTMKGDKLFRVIINWFTGKNKITGEDEAPLYKEIFIRSAKSLQLK